MQKDTHFAVDIYKCIFFMETFEYQMKIHWNIIRRFLLRVISGNGLGPGRREIIIWIINDLGYLRRLRDHMLTMLLLN